MPRKAGAPGQRLSRACLLQRHRRALPLSWPKHRAGALFGRADKRHQVSQAQFDVGARNLHLAKAIQEAASLLQRQARPLERTLEGSLLNRLDGRHAAAGVGHSLPAGLRQHHGPAQRHHLAIGRTVVDSLAIVGVLGDQIIIAALCRSLEQTLPHTRRGDVHVGHVDVVNRWLLASHH